MSKLAMACRSSAVASPMTAPLRSPALRASHEPPRHGVLLWRGEPEAGIGRRRALRAREFAVFADRGPHDKGVPPLHRGLLFRSRGKYSVSACRGRCRCPLQSAPVRTEGLFWRCPVLKRFTEKSKSYAAKTNSDLSRHYLPRQLRHLILQEYLSGVKTARQLSEEHGIPMSTIHKMGQRWKAKNSCSFVSTLILIRSCPALRVKKPVNYYPRTKPFGGAWKRLYYVWKAMRSWEISSKKNTVSTC